MRVVEHRDPHARRPGHHPVAVDEERDVARVAAERAQGDALADRGRGAVLDAEHAHEVIRRDLVAPEVLQALLGGLKADLHAVAEVHVKHVEGALEALDRAHDGLLVHAAHPLVLATAAVHARRGVRGGGRRLRGFGRRSARPRRRRREGGRQRRHGEYGQPQESRGHAERRHVHDLHLSGRSSRRCNFASGQTHSGHGVVDSRPVVSSDQPLPHIRTRRERSLVLILRPRSTG